MTSHKMKSILLLSILVLGFSGNVGMFEKSNHHTSSISHISSVISVPLAYAESDDGEGRSSDTSSAQDNSNNSNRNESRSNDQHDSENNRLQLNEENNKTQSEHEQENNKTQSEHEQENNKTQSEHEQESESEIENEHNNMNATHKMTEQDFSDIESAKANQTIAAEVNVGIGNVEHKSLDNNVMVQTANVTNDSVAITVNATSGTGPKVILLNLNSTTIDVSSINSMHVLYDGHPITPAANIDEIMHSTASDPPRYAILITQSGAQILISIPHFSTHTITLANMSKVIPAVPEFGSVVGVIITISTIGSIMMSRRLIKV